MRTCAESFIWRGYDLGNGGQAAFEGRLPIAVGWTELEMYPSHLAELRKEVEAKAAKDIDLTLAIRDLTNDVRYVAASNKQTLDEGISAREVFDLIASGELRGETKKHYRPSFATSYLNVTSRELFPIFAIETQEDTRASQKK